MAYLLQHNPVLAVVYAIAGCALLFVALDALRVGYIYSPSKKGRHTNLRYVRDSNPWMFWLSVFGWAVGVGVCFFLAFKVY